MGDATSPLDEFDPVDIIVDQARRLLDEHATPERLRGLLDVPGGFDAALWQQVVELGWVAAPIEENLGGFGLGWRVLFELAGLLGRYTAAVPIIPALVAADAVRHSASEQAPRFSSGAAIVALGLEAACGNGEKFLRVVDGRIEGLLPAVAFGTVANVLLTVAMGDKGPLLVLVELAQDGVDRIPLRSVDNGRSFARLQLNGVEGLVVGGEDRIERALLLAALATSFEQLGGAQRCLEMSCDYARERKVFGQPIGAFQAVKHKLADFYCAIEIARGCAFAAADRLEAGQPMRKEVAAARIMATRAYELAASETIQVFGAIGVTWEAAPHHHYRRSRALAVEIGAPIEWREILVTDLVGDREGERV